MRKILIVAIFFLIILLASIYGNTSDSKQTMTYDIDEVDKIVVNLDKADINVITADIDKIQVEISSNTLTSEMESYFSYIEEGTLYIRNYVKNENNILNTRTKVNIYIPEDANIEEILVDINQGSISLTDVELKTVNIQGEDVNVNIENSVIDNLDIATTFSKVNIKNTNTINVNIICVKANVEIDHLISKTLLIHSTEKVNIEFIDSVVETFNTTGENIQIAMTLYNTYDYAITTDIALHNDQFTQEGNTYTYDTSPQEGTNKFYFENTKINELNFSQK